ncbi:MAG: CAP domain-containing protein [Bacteroidales bacterium]
MKNTFLVILLFCCHYYGISQNWTNEELDRANAAKNVYSLTTQEKEVIKYINLSRLYPQKFANIEVKDYLGPLKYGDYLKTSSYKESLLNTLRSKTPVGLLYFDERMNKLATCFAEESGAAGKTGHNRTSCPYGYEGECCSYGPDQGRDIALQLLIDHDVPSLGHREICLDGNYDKVGVSIKPHTFYQSCCVLDFKRVSTEYVYTDPNLNRSNKSTEAIESNETIKTNETIETNRSIESNRSIETNNTTQYYKPVNNNQTIKKTEKITKTRNHKLLLFKIGSSVNFLFDDINNVNSSYNNQLSNQLNAMFGFNIGKSRKRTTIGLFGNYGKCNLNNTTLLNNSLFSASNNFIEIEGGFLIKEFFRISGGLGYTSLNSISFSSSKYTSFSSGFSFGPRWLKFEIVNTLLIATNNQKIIYRPSIGLSFVLGLINKKS